MTTCALVEGTGLPSIAAATFDELLSRFENEIYRFLLLVTRNRTEADELYQETATKAFRTIGRLDGAVDHRAWIYGLATGAFLRRQRQLDRELLPDEVDVVEERVWPDGPGLPREVAAEMARLPAKQRVAFVLRKFHDLSYDEIGKNLKCSEAAAREQAQNAFRILRDRLSSQL
jgi:RNA polymerase sigma-70 factor (ECF subfamily)